MNKQNKKTTPDPPKKPATTEIPPGATRQAWERPLDPGGGPPGSGAGPRHAAGDIGSDVETFGPTDTTRTPASPPVEEEDPLEKGPPYSGPSGGAVGGTPAQLRSAEGPPRSDDLPPEEPADATNKPAVKTVPRPEREGMIRLTGAAAIEYAEKQGLTLNKHPDSITGPRVGLSIAEAEAIADEDSDLIWLDVEKEEYYSGPPSNYEPER